MIAEGKTVLVFIAFVAAAAVVRHDHVPELKEIDFEEMIVEKRLQQKYMVLKEENDSLEAQLCRLRAVIESDSCTLILKPFK